MRTDVETVVQDAMRGAAAALCLEDLARDAVQPLCDAVGAHLGLCYRVEAGGGLRGAMARGGDGLLAEYLASGADDPLIEAKAAHNPRLAVTTDLVPRRRMRRSHVYEAFYRRVEAEHQLVARLTAIEYPHPGVISFVVCRSARAGGFVEADRALIGRVLPAMDAAARRIERARVIVRERDALAALAAQVGVYAVLELDGQARWLSATAERELGARPLPEPLAARVAELRALAAGEGRAGRADDVAVGGGPDARTVEPVLRRDGDAWSIVLYESRHELSFAAARAAAHYGLRPSEARVLDALARGKSNAAIAREQFRSCETVRTHVAHVLRKMMVRSRLEAIAKLRRFAER